MDFGGFKLPAFPDNFSRAESEILDPQRIHFFEIRFQRGVKRGRPVGELQRRQLGKNFLDEFGVQRGSARIRGRLGFDLHRRRVEKEARELHPDPLDKALEPAQAELVAEKADIGVNALDVKTRRRFQTPHRNRNAGILQGELVHRDAAAREFAQVERERDIVDLGDEASALVAVVNGDIPREQPRKRIQRQPPDRDLDGVVAERAGKGFLRAEPDPHLAQIQRRRGDAHKDRHQHEAHGVLPQKMDDGMDLHRAADSGGVAAAAPPFWNLLWADALISSRDDLRRGRSGNPSRSSR